jgi:hypothetical protein
MMMYHAERKVVKVVKMDHTERKEVKVDMERKAPVRMM